jgi:hypothetical protein
VRYCTMVLVPPFGFGCLPPLSVVSSGPGWRLQLSYTPTTVLPDIPRSWHPSAIARQSPLYFVELLDDRHPAQVGRPARFQLPAGDQ